MEFHRFVVLTEQGESGVRTAEFRALFASDARLRSPFLERFRPLSS